MFIRLAVFCLTLMLVIPVAVAETTPPEAVDPTAAQTPASTPSYPAAIQRMVDTGAVVKGQGIIGDLAFWVVQSTSTRAVFLTSPSGLLIRGKVYLPDGSLKFDTEAEQPLVLPSPAAAAEPALPASQRPKLATREQRNTEMKAALDLARRPSGPEAVWADLVYATGIQEGVAEAPLVYGFIDPLCPYCHQQWQALREKIEAGELQVRWVPIAILERTKRNLPQVLGMLAPSATAVDLQQWMTAKKPLPDDTPLAKLNLVKNMALFSRLGSKHVPTLIYKNVVGDVVMRTGFTPL